MLSDNHHNHHDKLHRMSHGPYFGHLLNEKEHTSILGSNMISIPVVAIHTKYTLFNSLIIIIIIINSSSNIIHNY